MSPEASVNDILNKVNVNVPSFCVKRERLVEKLWKHARLILVVCSTADPAEGAAV